VHWFLVQQDVVAPKDTVVLDQTSAVMGKIYNYRDKYCYSADDLIM